MGFFKRKGDCESLTVAEPTIVEQPLISVGELEKMVYSTYQEKLSLEKQLTDAKETIKRLEDQLTKLSAAETFSRQSEEERKRTDAKNERLQSQIDSLERQLKQSKSHAKTLEIKIGEMENANSGRMASYRRELVEEMQRQAVNASGNWSKNRVLDFLAAFLPGVEVMRDYAGTVTGSRDCDES